MTDADSCASRLSTVAGFCLGTIIIAPSLVGYAQGRRVENVRVEQVSLQGLVVIRYDLLSDQPQAVFEVRLEISVDDGETFSVTPSSVSGDIGADIPPGSGKRIVWESGREVAQLQADRLQARITLQTTSPAETLPLAAQGTVLTVNSVPTGATVSVDGATRGRTPLNLEGLSPGEHRIILALDGFLEHSRRVVMAEGQPELVLVTLTEIVEGALTGTSLDPEPSDGGISSKTLVLLGLAGGGAATIAALVGGSEDLASLPPLPDPRVPDPPPANTPPQGGSFTVNPTGVGLAFATNFQFSAIGVTDPDGDPITYFWEFGDGSGKPTFSGDGIQDVHGSQAVLRGTWRHGQQESPEARRAADGERQESGGSLERPHWRWWVFRDV